MNDSERESGPRDGKENQSSFEDTNVDGGRQDEGSSSESAPPVRRKADADGLEESLEEARRDPGEVY